jgi:chromosome segregation ATPase
MKMAQPNDLKQLLQCVADSFGKETGALIKAQVAEALGVESVDVAQLNAQIAAIQAALTPNTQGQADVAANLLAALTALTTRVSTLEGSQAVAELTAVVATLNDGLAAETQRAIAAEAAIDAKIAQINITLTEVNNVLQTVENGSSTGCDCPAINTQLAEIANDLSNLKANDASQSQKITDLQALVVVLQQAANAAETLINDAVRDAADAKKTADEAKAIAAVVRDGLDSLSTREAEHHAHHEARFDEKLDREHVTQISCADLTAIFKAGLLSGVAK